MAGGGQEFENRGPRAAQELRYRLLVLWGEDYRWGEKPIADLSQPVGLQGEAGGLGYS